MQSKHLGLTAVIALLALSSAPASASVIEFTSDAAFNTAVSGASTYNFAGIAPASGFVSGNVTVGGVTFSSDHPFVIDANAGYGSYGASFFSGQNSTPNLVATLAGATAIGFFYGDYYAASTPFSVTLSTGDIFNNLTTPVKAGVDTGFIGFTSDTQITSVAFAEPNDGDAYVFDVTQFVLASASSTVPEPATLALLGLGLAGMGAIRRRKQA